MIFYTLKVTFKDLFEQENKRIILKEQRQISIVQSQSSPKISSISSRMEMSVLMELRFLTDPPLAKNPMIKSRDLDFSRTSNFQERFRFLYTVHPPICHTPICQHFFWNWKCDKSGKWGISENKMKNFFSYFQI